MDVAFVTNVVYPFVSGGAQKRVHEIGTRLAASGHEVTVYARQFWDGSPTTEHEGLTLRAVADARDLYVDDRRSIAEAVEFGARLLGPLRREGATHDVVVVSVFPYFPVLATAAATLGGPPVVATWHEVWTDYWREYLGTLGPAGRLVERATAAMPQHPVAVSEHTANELARIGPSRKRITVVPNGIDVERIRSVRPAADGYDVLFAGRLTPAKNVGLLLDAFDRVAATCDATLGIIGEGPEETNLRATVDRMDHGDRVTMLGFLDDHEEVLAHQKAATAFVSPSTREGFGIAPLEAMAADCTVVVVDHPESASGDVVGDAGFVVQPTVETVAKALGDALAGDRPPADPVSAARRYDWDAIADRAERVYEEAANTANSRRPRLER